MNPYLTAKVRGKQCKIRILGQILQAKVSSKVFNVTVLLPDNPNRENPTSASILNPQANKESQSVQEPTAAELESFILNGPSPQPIVPRPEVNTEVLESTKLAHKMRGLNQRRGRAKLGRHTRGKGKSKRSAISFEQYRQQMTTAQPEGQQKSKRSPTKATLKLRLTQSLLQSLNHKNRCAKLEKRCSKLQGERSVLVRQLLQEKRASNLLIQSALNEGRVLTAEAVSIIEQAKKEKMKLEDAVTNEKRLSRDRIRIVRRRLHDRVILNKNKQMIEHSQCVDKMVLSHNKKVSELQEKWHKQRQRINGKVKSCSIFFHSCYYPFTISLSIIIELAPT